MSERTRHFNLNSLPAATPTAQHTPTHQHTTQHSHHHTQMQPHHTIPSASASSPRSDHPHPPISTKATALLGQTELTGVVSLAGGVGGVGNYNSSNSGNNLNVWLHHSKIGKLFKNEDIVSNEKKVKTIIQFYSELHTDSLTYH